MNNKTSTESAEFDRNISLRGLAKRVSYARAGSAAATGTGRLCDSVQKKAGRWAGTPGSPVRIICQNSKMKTKPIPTLPSNNLRSCLKIQPKMETLNYIMENAEVDMVASISSEMRADDLSGEEDAKKEETETLIVDAPSATSQGSNASQSNLAKTKLSRLFSSKKREYTRLKKTLIVQQNTVLKHLDSLKDIARRLLRLGETAPLNEELQLVAAGERLEGGELPLALDRPGFQVIDELSTKIYQIPEALLSLFNELLAQKDDFENGAANRIQLKKEFKDSISPDMLQELVVNLVNCVRTKLTESLNLARQSWYERSHLIDQTSKEGDELQVMRRRCNELERNSPAPLQDKTQFDIIIEEMKKELSSEKHLKETSREKLQQLEAQHRISRARVGDLESEIKEWATKVANLNANMRNLEQHLRAKETGYESKVRKLRYSTQTNESALDHLKVQRNALEMRIRELQNQIEEMSAATDETTIGLMGELRDLRKQHEVASTELAAVREANETLQRLLGEARAENAAAEAKCRQVIEFFQQARPLLLYKEDKETDDVALSLWHELHGTRQALRKAANEAACCRREKEKFLQTLSRMAEAGRGSNTNVVATDLLQKEYAIAEQTKRAEDLQNKLESTNDTICKYESKISELHLRLLKVQTDQYSYHPTPSVDLEDQIVNLHGSVDHFAKQNALLTTALVQKNILVERFDKSCVGQYQMLQMRSEIMRFLERRGAVGADQTTLLLGRSRSVIVNKVNKELKERFSECGCKFSLVENYRKEILTMEQLILMLQNRIQQNERQRVFHEKKISDLEHLLLQYVRFRQ